MDDAFSGLQDTIVPSGSLSEHSDLFEHLSINMHLTESRSCEYEEFMFSKRAPENNPVLRKPRSAPSKQLVSKKESSIVLPSEAEKNSRSDTHNSFDQELATIAACGGSVQDEDMTGQKAAPEQKIENGIDFLSSRPERQSSSENSIIPLTLDQIEIDDRDKKQTQHLDLQPGLHSLDLNGDPNDNAQSSIEEVPSSELASRDSLSDVLDQREQEDTRIIKEELYLVHGGVNDPEKMERAQSINLPMPNTSISTDDAEYQDKMQSPGPAKIGKKALYLVHLPSEKKKSTHDLQISQAERTRTFELIQEDERDTTEIQRKPDFDDNESRMLIAQSTSGMSSTSGVSSTSGISSTSGVSSSDSSTVIVSNVTPANGVLRGNSQISLKLGTPPRSHKIRSGRRRSNRKKLSTGIRKSLSSRSGVSQFLSTIHETDSPQTSLYEELQEDSFRSTRTEI